MVPINLDVTLLDGAYFVSLALYIGVKCTHAYRTALWLKMTTSTLFVAIAAARLAEQSSVFGLLIFLGLLCAWVGDYFLDMKYVTSSKKQSEAYTFNGFRSFCVAHLFNFAAMATRDNFSDVHTVYTLLAVAAVAALLSAATVGSTSERLCKVQYGKFKTITFVYGLLLLGVVLVAWGAHLQVGSDAKSSVMARQTEDGVFGELAIGLTLFLVSDLVLSQTFFGKDKHTAPFIVANYIFYYGAQWIVARAVGGGRTLL